MFLALKQKKKKKRKEKKKKKGNKALKTTKKKDKFKYSSLDYYLTRPKQRSTASPS
jgi:hypothetical protein